MQIYPDLSTKKLLSCLVFFVESQTTLFLPTSKNWFWTYILIHLLAFLTHSCHYLPACVTASILAGTQDWTGKEENSSGWKTAFQNGEVPCLYSGHWASHTDYPLTQWFTCWWAQPCNYLGILTLHFKLGGPNIISRVGAVAWKLGKYGGGQLEASSAIQ